MFFVLKIIAVAFESLGPSFRNGANDLRLLIIDLFVNRHQYVEFICCKHPEFATDVKLMKMRSCNVEMKTNGPFFCLNHM